MAKYMILYNSAASASETMANATPEQMKDSMNEWIAWKEEAEKTVKFDWGMPLQATTEITPDSVSDSTSQVSGYSTMESESKDAIIELLKTHPHLKRQGASIDVFEMLPMPGM